MDAKSNVSTSVDKSAVRASEPLFSPVPLFALPGLPNAHVSGAGEVREAGRAPFLVLEGRLDKSLDRDIWTLRDDGCPLEGFSAVDHTTGEIAWSATCKSARCYRCSRIVSPRSFAVARRAMDELDGERLRFVTLTLAPEDWQDLRKRMKDLVQFLRSRGIRVNWLWVVEEGSSTGMKHVHCVQWGDFIPWQELLGWWGARVQIEAAGAAIGYLGKNVIRYLGKGLDGDRE